MIYLGADVSTKELVIYDNGSTKHSSVTNSSEDIRDFFSQKNLDPDSTIVGCEATGDCHTAFCLVALEMGYRVKVINPLLTKQVINATVRKKKTDYSDSEIITKLLSDGQGAFVTKESFQQTKRTLIRTEHKLVHCQGMLKVILGTLKEKSKVMEIEQALKSVQICINTLEKESAKLTKEFTENQNRQEQIIDSVPGCAKKLAAVISAEAGDIKRFPSSSQFKAYAGIDPKVTQSGSYCHTGKMTKRGNPTLRYALFLAANVARRKDPDLQKFYEKKRGEGKSHRHAVCTIARKLCERIHTIVKKDCFYQIQNPA